MKKAFQACLVVLTFVLGLGVGNAIWPDSEVDFGVARILRNGLAAWKIGAVVGADFDVVENTNLGATVLSLDATDGSMSIRARTSTQLSTLAPSAADEMVMNTTVHSLCISTGTGAGAWVSPSTSTVYTAKPCY